MIQTEDTACCINCRFAKDSINTLLTLQYLPGNKLLELKLKYI
jgi:hypothetical protein